MSDVAEYPERDIFDIASDLRAIRSELGKSKITNEKAKAYFQFVETLIKEVRTLMPEIKSDEQALEILDKTELGE